VILMNAPVASRIQVVDQRILAVFGPRAVGCGCLERGGRTAKHMPHQEQLPRFRIARLRRAGARGALQLIPLGPMGTTIVAPVCSNTASAVPMVSTGTAIFSGQSGITLMRTSASSPAWSVPGLAR